MVSGIGVGGGGSIHGLTVAGVGAGVGGSINGLRVGTVRGLTFAGVGLGARKGVDDVTIAALGIGSPAVRKLAIAPLIGTSDARGIIIAPAYFKVTEGSMRGVNIATINDIRGDQRGLAIGRVNYARSLKGLQLGLINIVTDGRGPRVLPIANFR